MNASEFFAFIPAIVVVAISVFVAWRVSRTGSVAVPAEMPFAKQPNATPAKTPSDSTNSENRTAGSSGRPTTRDNPVKMNVSYSTFIGVNTNPSDIFDVLEERVVLNKIEVDSIPVIYDIHGVLKEPRQTAH